MKRLRLLFFKSVRYWNTYEGEGYKKDGTKDDRCWLVDVSYLNCSINLDEVDDVQEAILNYINSNLHHLKTPLKASDLMVVDGGGVSFSLIENVKGEHIENEDDCEEQLYIGDYDIVMEIQDVRVPNSKEMYKLLPDAERG